MRPRTGTREAPAAVRAFHCKCRLLGRLTLGFRESLAGAGQHSRATSALRGGVLAVGAARVAAFSALVVRILPLAHTPNCRAQSGPHVTKEFLAPSIGTYPESSRIVAIECRRRCGYTRLVMPASRAHAAIMAWTVRTA